MTTHEPEFDSKKRCDVCHKELTDQVVTVMEHGGNVFHFCGDNNMVCIYRFVHGDKVKQCHWCEQWFSPEQATGTISPTNHHWFCSYDHYRNYDLMRRIEEVMANR